MLSPIRSESFHKKFSKDCVNHETCHQEILNLAENYNYEEIFTYFSEFDYHALKEIRKIILLKYFKEDDEVIRTHSSRKKLWLLMSGAFSSIK